MSGPAFPIDPRIVADQGAAPPFDDSAIADSSDEEDSDKEVAPASAVPRRFSRRESRGATKEEIRRLSNASGSHRPSFGSNSLKPSTVFHLTENEGSSSSTTVRRPSHSSTSSPAPPASEQQNYLPQLAEHQDQTPPLVERTSFTIEEPSSTDEGTDGLGGDGRDTGSLYSTRGALILFTVGMSQLLDNVSMTSVNMALTAISKELNIGQADEQWLISAYTLTFGGFLLLAGVFADRYGKKPVFLVGMFWLSLWTLVDGFAKTEIQLIVFRAMQGLGAAATVPSSVGIISAFFLGKERNYALAIYGACGALGFVVGLIYGGILTTVLGWRWVFWLTCPIGVIVAGMGAWLIPNPKIVHIGPKPSMDFLGTALGTGGLILLTFVLSSGGELTNFILGFIIALLVISVGMLVAFAFAEKKVSNPLLPSHLWKMPNFAATWAMGFIVYCWWQSLVLYLTIISQNILLLSPLQTAIRFIPMGPMGLLASYFAGWCVVFPLPLLSMISPIPAAVMSRDTSFWASIFPSSILGVVGISIVYNVVSISMMSAVPPAAKSLAGGLINTAFQVGSGAGLAICAAVVTGVTSKMELGSADTLLKGYQVRLFLLFLSHTTSSDFLIHLQSAMYTTIGFCGVGLALAVFGIDGSMLEVGPSSAPVH
ncbi:major facilitator superfamily domain-containing protein [Mrakia frigida]|uniref:major facilitator superfamily domain-containing protein n=1 Tax=Mrakia frigida TaxID=29902 RepID=UPI003FCC1523